MEYKDFKHLPLFKERKSRYAAAEIAEIVTRDSRKEYHVWGPVAGLEELSGKRFNLLYFNKTSKEIGDDSDEKGLKNPKRIPLEDIVGYFPLIPKKRRLVRRKKGFNPDSIKELREKAGLSQVGLARALGTTATTIRNWEHGRSTPIGAGIKALEKFVQEEEIAGIEFYKK